MLIGRRSGSGELSVGIQLQPMPSFHVGVFGKLPLFIDLELHHSVDAQRPTI